MTNWTDITKSSSSWNNASKNVASWSNQPRSFYDTIYLASELGDYYLVGSIESEFLVTQEPITWNNQTKN